MSPYKKLKNGRKKQVSYIYDKMAENEYPIDNYNVISYDKLFMMIDMYWKNIFPIEDVIDADRVCKRIFKKIFILDIDNEIDINDLIYIYINLFYLENFINSSIIQNSSINSKYSFIKDYLYRFESRTEFIRIKY